MPLKIKRFDLWLHYDTVGPTVVIDYTPVAEDAQGAQRPLFEYKTQLRIANLSDPDAKLPDALRRKLTRLAEYVQTQLAPPEIELEGLSVRGAPALRYYQVRLEPGPELNAAYVATPVDKNLVEKRIEISDATLRLIANILPICEHLAWSHIRERLGQEAKPIVTTKRKILLSYRKGNHSRQRFVRSIADRLGREGFLPWYDEWEIHAGDSIAREVASGFREAYGIVIVLSADYPGGRWAREELETAITKRVEENTRIIPILYEDCAVPELLRPLRYVNCTEHTETNIERQFADLIDALNEIELNPYR